jgi:hypothetical protein
MISWITVGAWEPTAARTGGGGNTKNRVGEASNFLKNVHPAGRFQERGNDVTGIEK